LEEIKISEVNLLFVCSRNKWRSATAEIIYKSSADHRVRSGGTEPSAVVKVSAKDILWADLIFAMEKKHKQRLVEKFPEETQSKKIVVLDIEDNYEFMDEELIENIKASVEPYLSKSPK
jgi:protein-tyrosine phosphatase